MRHKNSPRDDIPKRKVATPERVKREGADQTFRRTICKNIGSRFVDAEAQRRVYFANARRTGPAGGIHGWRGRLVLFFGGEGHRSGLIAPHHASAGDGQIPWSVGGLLRSRLGA